MLYNPLRRDYTATANPIYGAGVLIAIISALALVGAWSFELIGGYLPCPLCLEERIPYYAAIPIGFGAAYFSGLRLKISAIILGLLVLALYYNAAIGVYHAGAEWHFWPGPDTCGSSQDVAMFTPGNLSKSLQNNRPIRCDEAALRILGISLAGYSAIISAILALTGTSAVRRALKSAKLRSA